MSAADERFERCALLWCRRWAVKRGEHQNAGRYVWEAVMPLRDQADRVLAVWCHRRWFEAVRNARGVEVKAQQSEYRGAIDAQPLRHAWSDILTAMADVKSAALQAAIRDERSA